MVGGQQQPGKQPAEDRPGTVAGRRPDRPARQRAHDLPSARRRRQRRRDGAVQPLLATQPGRRRPGPAVGAGQPAAVGDQPGRAAVAARQPARQPARVPPRPAPAPTGPAGQPVQRGQAAAGMVGGGGLPAGNRADIGPTPGRRWQAGVGLRSLSLMHPCSCTRPSIHPTPARSPRSPFALFSSTLPPRLRAWSSSRSHGRPRPARPTSSARRRRPAADRRSGWWSIRT